MDSRNESNRLEQVVSYLNDLLQVGQIRDWKNALNGLQVMNSGRATRVAAAVDASERTIRTAIDRGCDFMLVHHGLFWSGNRPVTGRRYRALKLLIDHDVAVYSAHLPLDVHPEFGNNALLARQLELTPSGSFASHEGRDIGLVAECELDLSELVTRLETALGSSVRVIEGGNSRVRRVGILTGSGGSTVEEAALQGVDTLVTGEGSHHTFIDAMESGVNLLYGGHYATETWGVRALAEHLAARFDMGWDFIDAPTGL